MACLENLQKIGWNIAPNKYKLVSKDNQLRDQDSIAKYALDVDIKEYGSPVLVKDLNSLSVPVVLQIQKLRNIAAPKINETSGAAPRLLKLTLTDGHTTCQALEIDSPTKIDIIKTPPGSKIILKKAQTFGSFLLISSSNCTLLGGNVPQLVERWQLAKMNIKNIRTGSDGPPPWVPFGQKVTQTVIADQNFKSLVQTKEQTKGEFDHQRQEAIAEAAQGAVKKTFGGGNNKPVVREIRFNNDNRKVFNKPARHERKKNVKEREQNVAEVGNKPSGKISLFAFLEDKLPTESFDDKKPSYAEKYDASLRHKDVKKPETKPPRFQKYDFDRSKNNRYQDGGYKPNNRIPDKPKFNDRYDFAQKPKFNDRPPQDEFFQKSELIQKTENLRIGDDLSNEKRQNEMEVQKKVATPSQWQWRIGDRCLAKYWEDNQYYNASITNVTPKTCLVQFNEYGNFEEVLKSDCIPVMAQSSAPPLQNNSNRQYTGSLIFRRGGSNSQANNSKRN